LKVERRTLKVERLPQILILPKDSRAFRHSLLGWYRKNGRDLPWRPTRDPYPILVSELMLHQTQVATVLPYYNKWLDRFPNFAVLASAPENDVLRAWEGLGYYARARNLQATAKIVQQQHNGRLPSSIKELRSLPGVGKYTAHAVATFAFHQAVPIVEANTARVLARLLDLRIPIDSAAGHKFLWNLAAQILPKRGAAHYNSALVDLGALICLPRRPKCPICPVKQFCLAKNPESLPLKKARPGTRRLVETHAFVVRRGRILLERSSKRWRGMWILPPIKARLTIDQPIYLSIFPFTNHHVTLKIYRRRPRKINNSAQRWTDIGSLGSIPISSPHRRAIVDLLNATPGARSRPQQSSTP
jgi:A/G-specific adenine glycosylase